MCFAYDVGVGVGLHQSSWSSWEAFIDMARSSTEAFHWLAAPLHRLVPELNLAGQIAACRAVNIGKGELCLLCEFVYISMHAHLGYLGLLCIEVC